ncbi:fumarylacetoacetate hydrolase family protein [Streptomyces sp. NPDC088725]|uniref:fumarylacetoacetate hydrolase family protein n=1 Tax=Streptomyces sp. NPDC088725 TaxID=3365873 RepID=UPI0038121DBB
MRIAHVNGRLSLVVKGGTVDVGRVTGGRFGSDPQSIYERWGEFRDWADGFTGAPTGPPPADGLGSPAPGPGQVFAIGLNYRDHADESNLSIPKNPLVFTKFPSSITGPRGRVVLPEGSVDWEVELVVVMGARARRVSEDRAWDAVAGVTVGQDLSERVMQHSGPAPQFGLAKSFPGFSPMGPVLVTPDEFDDPDDLSIGCAVDGEVVQRGRTSQMIFSVPELIARLSAVLPLSAGDVIFTGTPSGVGAGRTPPRFLRPGERLRSWIDGVGEMEHEFVAQESEGEELS